MVDLGAITYFLNREDLREVEEIKYEGWGKVCELYHSVGGERVKILSLNYHSVGGERVKILSQ